VFDIRTLASDAVICYTGTKQSLILHDSDIVCLCNDALSSECVM
jgi:hypothetical protein